MNTDVMFSNKSDEWETPQNFFDELNAEFKFTLDPCATEKNHKCKKFYTVTDNGLSYKWLNESVFCNPPYSKIKDWAYKCRFESVFSGATVVMLVPSRTDTKWFHDYVYGSAEIRFVKGRLKFGDGKNSAPFPSMIAIFHALK